MQFPVRWFAVAVVLACLGALGVGSASAVARECRPVVITERGDRPTRPSAAPLMPRVTIESPGHYCMDRDLHQDSLRDPLRGAPVFAREEALVRIRSSGVTLDLGGHTVSNAMQHGMTMIWFSRFAVGESGGTRLLTARIANGHLVSPGSSGVGIDLTASRPYGQRSLQPAPVPEGVRASDLFADTRHIVESMTIAAGKRGIQLDGRDNIIRNNLIIVDSPIAIVAQGPGIVIENNVIEVRNDLSQFSEQAKKVESRTPFPIRLIQADGAIVRNNRIRLVQPAAHGPLPAAIELLQSADVLVESNQFEGVGSPVQADSDSSYREFNNQLAVCAPGAPRYLPPPEAGVAGGAGLAACR